MDLFGTFAAAMGRPRAIEGEQMVVSDGLMASMVRPGQGGVYFMPVDEIIRSKGWKVYKDMLHDDQVKSCLAFKKILIHGRTWEMKPYSESARDKEVATFVEYCLHEINFDHMVEETLSSLEFGYSLGELVWTREPKKPGEYPLIPGSQIVCLEKIAHRDPQQLYLQIDSHGNYTGVKQLSLGQDIQLSPDKTFLYSHNKRFGNIYGESDLRSAYRSYWAKKFIINFWNVFLERMGSPMMMMKYPQGSSQQLQDTLMKILKNLGSKTEVLVPEGVEVDLVEATRSGTATYQEALGFHNNSIARSILMASLFGTGGETNSSRGSDSMSFLQLRILFKMADAIAQNVSREFMCQVVKQLVEFNYGVDTPMPIFIWQDYGQFEGMKIADEIRQLHAAGILEMDQADVNYARSVLGLPIRDDDNPDEVIRPAALPLTGQGGVPPAAPQGNDRASKGGSAESDSTGSGK